MSNNSKNSFIGELQKVITMLQGGYANKTFALDGKAWKTVDIVGVCQAAITAMQAVDPSKVTYESAVEKQKTAVAAAKVLVAALKVYIGVVSGKTSETFKNFGFGAKPATPTPTTKVAAAQARAATRKVRGTLGKRQRKAIKASAAAAPTAPAVTTPTNGVAK
jgi:hypothetical protein